MVIIRKQVFRECVSLPFILSVSGLSSVVDLHCVSQTQGFRKRKDVSFRRSRKHWRQTELYVYTIYFTKYDLKSSRQCYFQLWGKFLVLIQPQLYGRVAKSPSVPLTPVPTLCSLHVFVDTCIRFCRTNLSRNDSTVLDSQQRHARMSATPRSWSSGCSQCNFLSNIEDKANIFVSLFQMRNNFRHYFIKPPQLKLLYDVITWIVTQIAISYTVVPFVLLSVKPSFMFYR